MLNTNYLNIGDVIANRYELIKQLGKGGFADIWEAKDRSLPDRANQVLKILTRNDLKAIQRLRQEFRLLQDLEHENIIKVESLYPTHEPTVNDYFLSFHFFVMEKVTGCNLEEFCQVADPSETTLQSEQSPKQSVDISSIWQNLGHWLFRTYPPSRSPCSYIQIADWIEKIALTLQYLHHHNIVHGDLKPSNIMITANHQIKLIDFGAARVINQGDLAKYREYIDKFDRKELTRIYTPEYASPEQRMGQVGFRSDFYSFGHTIIFMLTGQHPSNITANWQVRIPLSLLEFLKRTIHEDPLERHADTRALLVHAQKLSRSLRNQFDPIAIVKQMGILLGIAAIATISTLGMRAFGILQSMEFATYDQMLRMRPEPQIKSPILIIAIRDQQSISDRDLATVISHVFPDRREDAPKLVSIGIKRDENVDHTGQQDLENLFKKLPNLFGSCEYDSENSQGFNFIPTPTTPLGFGNNLFYKSPNEVRRIHLLMYRDLTPDNPPTLSHCHAHISQSLLLAHYYLYNSYPQPPSDRLLTDSHSTYSLGLAKLQSLKIGQAAFQGGTIDPFKDSFQILLDYYNFAPPQKESFTNVLKNKLSPEIVRDKIILIGRDDRGLANSKDLTQPTPYGSMSSIELRSHMIGQLISIAQGNRPVLRPASFALDSLGILAIAIFSGFGCWRITSYTGKFVLMISLPLLVYGGCFLILLTQGLWLGFVPIAITSASTNIIIAIGFHPKR